MVDATNEASARVIIMKLRFALACFLALSSPTFAGRELRESIVVIDGDTVRAQGVTVRLLGFDAPETYNAQCAFENELGMKAKRRLEAMINHSETISMQSTGRLDRYGRTLGTLIINGMDVADTMILEELAVPYEGGKRRNWC
jgi:endonuclease YncB( thermonuclease family)